MDIYFKTVAGALIAMLLCLMLAKQGKDFGLLLGILACCMIAVAAARFLGPVVEFFGELEAMIPLESSLLQIMMKVTGIGMIGELAAMICADSGSSTLGKALQILTSVLILWLSLPLLRSLLELVSGILEDLG